MSRNLLKYNFTYNAENPPETRVIDSNSLVEKRLEELNRKLLEQAKGAKPTGFVEGILAEDVSALLTDEDAEAGVLGTSVIKGAEGISKEDADELLEQVNAQAEEILAEARARAETIVQDAVDQAEMSKKSVMDEARMKGYRDGGEKAKAEYEQRYQELEREKQRLEDYRRGLEAEYQKQLDEMEPQLVDTITGIYERIFQVELAEQREILLHLIGNTLRKTEGSREFLVHVSKEDYAYVSMQKKQLAEGSLGSNMSLEIVEDVTLDKNQCIIETEGGLFDCGIGTQLSELRAKLTLLAYTRT